MWGAASASGEHRSNQRSGTNERKQQLCARTANTPFLVCVPALLAPLPALSRALKAPRPLFSPTASRHPASQPTSLSGLQTTHQRSGQLVQALSPQSHPPSRSLLFGLTTLGIPPNPSLSTPSTHPPPAPLPALSTAPLTPAKGNRCYSKLAYSSIRTPAFPLAASLSSVPSSLVSTDLTWITKSRLSLPPTSSVAAICKQGLPNLLLLFLPLFPSRSGHPPSLYPTFPPGLSVFSLVGGLGIAKRYVLWNWHRSCPLALPSSHCLPPTSCSADSVTALEVAEVIQSYPPSIHPTLHLPACIFSAADVFHEQSVTTVHETKPSPALEDRKHRSRVEPTKAQAYLQLRVTVSHPIVELQSLFNWIVRLYS